MVEGVERLCARCGVQPRLSYHSYCGACKRSYSAEWKAANKDKVAASNRRYKANRPTDRKPERSKDPHRQRKNHLKHKYGLTLEEWRDIYDEQGGVCPGCRQPLVDRTPCVDHDHATGAVRGILCVRCNSGMGLLSDDPETLERLVVYLRRSRE